MKGIILRTLIFIGLPALASFSAEPPATPNPATTSPAAASVPSQASVDFAKQAEKLRQSAIHNLEPKVTIPTSARVTGVSNRYPWKTGIVTLVFWIGTHPEDGADAHPASAWDPQWRENYGGSDNPQPEARRDFVPTAFVPKLNPFYLALPFNDIAGSETKPEAKVVVPWFQTAFIEEGKSVCRDRWVAVRGASGKVCYAQWCDCGPFSTDHWEYVFGNEKPRPNEKQGAGLSVSPAVRDFLGLQATDVTDWKFVDFKEVPKGPWALYGSNNAFLPPLPAPTPPRDLTPRADPK